jgi:membrane protein
LPASAHDRATQLRRRYEALRAWIERTLLWRVWERLAENEFVDRSVALGAKAFISFFPAIIVVSAFTPSSVRTSIITTITNRAGLSGQGLATVKGAFATSDDTRRATGFVGLFFTFFYINSFTTALCRVYTRAWRRPPGGRASGYVFGAAWLIGIAAYLALIGGMRAVLGSGPELPIFVVGVWLFAVGLWWLTPWLMLQRQVRFRVLSTSAFLTGTGLVVFGATASLWMPRTVANNQHQFGFFGVAIALVTWLSGAAMVIVVCACAAPALAEDEGWIGRLVRGPDPSLLVPNARAALEGPTTAPTIVDALGVRREDRDRVDERV